MSAIATRRETVHLEVTGGFVGEMAEAAASVALLRRELDGLGRTRISSSVNQSLSSVDRDARRADGSINQLTGRLGLAADAVLLLGSGLAPIGAAGVQAIGGLAAATLGLAAAGGAALTAFKGVGDATKAIREYDLDPTVANLEKVQDAFAKLGPDAQTFVLKFQELRPVLGDIKRQAEAGLFPGLTEAIDDVDQLADSLGKIFKASGSATGLSVGDDLASLQSSRWRPFMRFVEEEAPNAIFALNRIMGDLAHGASEMLMVFDPSNDAFLRWLEDVADGFDDWAKSSRGRDDIQAFMDYTRQNGPEVAAFFSSLVDASTQVVKAMAPLGGPTLTILTKVLDIVAGIAGSDIGTPFLTGLIGLRTYSRMLAMVQAQQSRLAATPAPGTAGIPRTGLSPGRAQIGQAAAVVGGSALIGSGLTEQLNMSNTAALTLAGTMAGPLGAGVGFVAGSMMDAAAANDAFFESMESTQDLINQGDFSNFAKSLEDLTAMGETTANDIKGGMASSLKNDIEGLFGDSDLEEVARGIQETQANALNAAKAVGQMGRAFGMTVGPIDGSKKSTEQLLRVVDKMQPKMDKLGITTADLATARKLQNGVLGRMSGLTPYDDLIDQLRTVSHETRAAISFTQAFTAQLKRAQGFLDRNAAIDAYEASIDALTASIKKNGTAFDRTTEKGRANRAALRDIASNGLVAAEKLKGLARVEFMNNLRGQFKEAADKLGLNQQQTQRWMEQLGILNRIKAIPTIDANNTPLQVAIAASKALLASINGDTATTYIKTIRLGGDAVPGGPRGGSYASADGGSVPKTGLAYADRHHYLLADGEEVISNRHGQADRHRSLLKAINAGRLADGGTTGDGGGMDLVGGLGGAANGAARALKGLRHELDKSRKVLEKEKEKRQEFLSIRSEVGSSLTGSLTGTGLAGFDLGVAAGTNDNRQAIRNLIELKKKGLDGPLFDLVAGSGDPALIAQFADLSRKQINQRERRYGALTSSQNRLGGLAAEAQVGQTLSSLNATIKELNKKIDTLEHRVERGAHKGTRGRKKDQDRETRNRTRSRR